jgi:CheY-like chemotaxis protein
VDAPLPPIRSEPLRERAVSDPSTGGRILLVEDNEINAEVALDILTRAGFRCDHVRTGRDAVAAAQALKYRLVLMDCHLPEMDGFEAARRIRAHERRLPKGFPRIPIVAVTACATRDDRESCLAAGMNDYLSKPLRPEQLLHMVRAHLTGRPEPRAPQPVIAADQMIDLEAALERVEGRHDFLWKLAEQCRAHLHEHLTVLRRAVGARDAKAVAAAAHRLKGEVATFDAGRVMAAAEELETRADDTRADALLNQLTVEVGKLEKELTHLFSRPTSRERPEPLTVPIP